MEKVYKSKTKETVYVFGDKYVIHKKSNKPDEGSGVFKTRNMSVRYGISKVENTQCMVLGATQSKYPYGLLKGDIAALSEAILYISDKEQLRVMQAHHKPDYGFETLSLQTSVKNMEVLAKNNVR
ncbi:MAG: hypothetical protein KGI06_00350 [Candidatus Micrarchaeota archaeon]|nr:hypothetical protein [Candidatus Micrarchaeota archaeon]